MTGCHGLSAYSVMMDREWELGRIGGRKGSTGGREFLRWRGPVEIEKNFVMLCNFFTTKAQGSESHF